MRIRAALLALVLSACVSATPRLGEASWLVGSWKMMAMGARALPAESPTEPGVTVTDGNMTLDRGGRFEMRLQARLATRPGAADRSIAGNYELRRDSLIMIPDGEPEGTMRFRFVENGGRLVLQDERGSAFEFVRAASVP